MTRQDEPDEVISASDAKAQPLENHRPAPAPGALSDGPSWFGFIGLGIALVSLLIGIAGVVVAVIWFIGWTHS